MASSNPTPSQLERQTRLAVRLGEALNARSGLTTRIEIAFADTPASTVKRREDGTIVVNQPWVSFKDLAQAEDGIINDLLGGKKDENEAGDEMAKNENDFLDEIDQALRRESQAATDAAMADIIQNENTEQVIHTELGSGYTEAYVLRQIANERYQLVRVFINYPEYAAVGVNDTDDLSAYEPERSEAMLWEIGGPLTEQKMSVIERIVFVDGQVREDMIKVLESGGVQWLTPHQNSAGASSETGGADVNQLQSACAAATQAVYGFDLSGWISNDMVRKFAVIDSCECTNTGEDLHFGDINLSSVGFGNLFTEMTKSKDFRDILHQFIISDYSRAYSLGINFNVNETTVGRLFLGAVEKVNSGKLSERQAAEALETLTDIPAQKVYDSLLNSGGNTSSEDFSKRANGLRTLFETAQYGNIFTNAAVQTSLPTGTSTVAPDKPSYSKNDNIRIRFDFVDDSFAYDEARVYLNNVQGNRVFADPIYTLSSGGQLFLNVPVAAVDQAFYGAGITANGIHGEFKLEVVLVRDGSEVGVSKKSEAVEIDTIKSLQNVTLAPENVPGWNEMSETERATVREALTFTFPNETNQALVEWTVKQFIYGQDAGETHNFEWQDDNSWAGKEYLASDGVNNLGGECKWWVDDVLVKGAFNGEYDLPSNIPNDNKSYKWGESDDVEIVGKKHAETDTDTLEGLIQSGVVQSGDMVQYTNGTYQHTIMIGAVTDTGVWVFDSNNKKDRIPRYKKVDYEKLNADAKLFTACRLNDEK